MCGLCVGGRSWCWREAWQRLREWVEWYELLGCCRCWAWPSGPTRHWSTPSAGSCQCGGTRTARGRPRRSGRLRSGSTRCSRPASSCPPARWSAVARTGSPTSRPPLSSHYPSIEYSSILSNGIRTSMWVGYMFIVISSTVHIYMTKRM